jgi:hypothetical protein
LINFLLQRCRNYVAAFESKQIKKKSLPDMRSYQRHNILSACIVLVALTFFCLSAHAEEKEKNNQAIISSSFTIHPEKYKQTVWGIGFEIQSDAIGTGNTGMPDNKHAVPHDLTPSERERFATEMLKGFRYCRLAGGLYWRGLDPEQKYMQARWPEQLEELKEMLDKAGVEGVSLEYWSPAPFWKANNSYIQTETKETYNTLRCFGPGFATDPVYKGDTVRFLHEFGQACVKDIETLKNAGIKTSMWGLQNEPWASNPQYSSCKYFSAGDYIRAYVASAGAIRKYDPQIMIFSDTESSFPHKIAKGMHRPKVADLVDAYVVHTIGSPSENVMEVDKKIKEKLPFRPWFQNEYEYLQRGATPERCLNTVQHIMNSFQLAGNPTWFWIHALKPFKNSEASGYSLGFWKSLDDTSSPKNIGKYERWLGGPEITQMPDEFKNMEFVNVLRTSDKKPGLEFSFVLNQKATVYLVVEQKGNFVPEGWEKTDVKVSWVGGTDVICKKVLNEGTHAIGQHTGSEAGMFGAPHACFFKGEGSGKLEVSVGINSPIKIRSEAMKLELAAAEMKPGHWIYNDYNWNAVGSFVKHIPWDSRVIEVTEGEYNKDVRILALEKPNGKRIIVVSNRTGEKYHVKINTTINADWNGYRYTPWNRGENSMGILIGSQKGAALATELPDLSWEFWEEQ